MHAVDVPTAMAVTAIGAVIGSSVMPALSAFCSRRLAPVVARARRRR